MMSKKDYEKAAKIAQRYRDAAVVDAFTTLFVEDGNPRFDARRFHNACVPGANVRARS